MNMPSFKRKTDHSNHHAEKECQLFRFLSQGLLFFWMGIELKRILSIGFVLKEAEKCLQFCL